MSISREIKVGFVAIVSIALLVWGYNYLKGTNIFFKSKSVYAIYPKVPGLAVSAPIIINGVQSGVVDAIYFHEDKSSRVIVRLNITESELIIPKNSIAELISVDFMGSKAVGLKLGDSSENLESGDTLQSEFEISMLEDFSEQMLPIKEKAENMMVSMDSAIMKFNETMVNLDDLFNNRNKKRFELALFRLDSTIYSYNMLAKNLNSTIHTSIKPTMKTFKNLGDSLTALDMRNTLDKAQSALDNMSAVMDKMNRGEGTMGKLINNDSLYNNMTGATKEMEELLEDIKLHPKRYFRVLSRKEIPYKKGK